MMYSWERQQDGDNGGCCTRGRRGRRRGEGGGGGGWKEVNSDQTRMRSQVWVTGIMLLVITQQTGVVEGEALYLNHIPPSEDQSLPPDSSSPAPIHDSDIKLPGRYFPKLPYLLPYLDRPIDPYYNHHHRDDPSKPYYHRHHFSQQPHDHNTNHHQQQHQRYSHSHHNIDNHQQQAKSHNLHHQPQSQQHQPSHNLHHSHPNQQQFRNRETQNFNHDYNHQLKEFEDEEEEDSMVEPVSLPSIHNANRRNHHNHHHHRNSGDYPMNRKSNRDGRGRQKEEEEEEGGYLFRVSEEEEGGRRQIIAVKGGRRKGVNFEREDDQDSKHSHQNHGPGYQPSEYLNQNSEDNPHQYEHSHQNIAQNNENPNHNNPNYERQHLNSETTNQHDDRISPSRINLPNPAPPSDSTLAPSSDELPARDEGTEVELPPGPSFDRNLPRNITIQTGKTAVLSCRVFNVNDKSVSWIRQENLHILTVDKYKYSTDQRVSVVFNEPNLEWVLRIRAVTPEDAGQYECQVSTKPVLSFVVNMSIVVPRAWILNSPEIHVHRGSPINLTCVVTHGTERPVFIYWFHHNKVLDYGGRSGVRVETATERDTVSHLLVERAGPEDAGQYTCAPSNGVDASVNLHVLNGEYQAAMQTNGGDGKGGTQRGVRISALLFSSLLLSLFSSPLLS